VTDPIVDHNDPDVLCPLCGLHTFGGCVCPRREPTADEIEAGREERLSRAERAKGSVR
jgi:hypothetical protein